MPNSTAPINHTPYIGYRVDTPEDEDGNVIPPSTLANQVAEDNKGHNPDFFPSDGKTKAEQDEVGKGANPSADIVTKNTTTIDPVFREPTPVADNRTIPETVPASLPLNAPVTAPSGDVTHVGDAVEPEQDYTEGVLKPQEMKAGAGRDGKIEKGEIVQPAEVVYGDAAVEQAKKNEEKAVTGDLPKAAGPELPKAVPAAPAKAAPKEVPVKAAAPKADSAPKE